ncbi:MAG TPA: glucosaminidase domain-containing protein [Archangium sp.]|nr:glucosaminidase domain-containing protein [Archangium sp.]
MSRQCMGNQVSRWVVGLVLLMGLAGSGTAQAQWDCYAPQPGHPTSAEKTAYIEELKVYAQEAEARWGTPAAALLAMAANESGYGFTRIGLYANNLYGWKWTNSEAAGGRAPYVLACQPSWDPNNKYVSVKDRRDAVHFIGMKLATLARYKPVTERYVSDIRGGVAVTTAINRWVQGIQTAGYNPYASYVTKTVSYLNNHLTPSSTYSSTYNLYKYSPVTGAVEDVWVSIDAPSPGATVSGSVAFNASVGGGAVDTVKLYSRRDGTTDWYLLASDTTSPHGATWATSPSVADGAYELKAEAWKHGGLHGELVPHHHRCQRALRPLLGHEPLGRG